MWEAETPLRLTIPPQLVSFDWGLKGNPSPYLRVGAIFQERCNQISENKEHFRPIWSSYILPLSFRPTREEISILLGCAIFSFFLFDFFFKWLNGILYNTKSEYENQKIFKFLNFRWHEYSNQTLLLYRVTRTICTVWYSAFWRGFLKRPPRVFLW